MPSTYSLRLATADDVPALAALYAQSARTLGPRVYTSEQVIAWASFGRDTPAFRDYVLNARTWIADAGDGPLGFCGIHPEGEVHSLYVHPDLFGQGLGGRLLAHALRDARTHGATRFAAWATPFSRPVFQRFGFVIVRFVEELYQGVLFERCRMECRMEGD